MLFHENFIRCPFCDCAYFERKEYVQLNKTAFMLPGEKVKPNIMDLKNPLREIKEEEINVHYTCQKCHRLMYQIKLT